MGNIESLKKMFGIDATNVTATAGSKGLKLPLEYWNVNVPDGEKQNVFVDIGKDLVYLAQKNLKDFGYIDLDKVWQLVKSEQLVSDMNGVGDLSTEDLAKRIEELKARYETPFDGHRVYLAIAYVDIENDPPKEATDVVYKFAEDVVKWTQKTNPKNKNELMFQNDGKTPVYNTPTVTFSVCQFYAEELGFVDEVNLDTHEKKPRGDYKFVKFGPFVDVDTQNKWLLKIKECQEERNATAEQPSKESVYLIVSGISPVENGHPGLNWDDKYKSLKGYLDDLWCWN